MPRFLKKISEDFQARRNIELYLTITIVLVLLVLDIFNLADLDWLIEAILATLGLLAYSIIITRDQINRLTHLSEETHYLITSMVSAKQDIDQILVPLTKSDINEKLKRNLLKASEVRMCGWSLIRTIDDNRHYLREFVKRGGKLRILLLDPESDAINEIDNVITGTDPLERRTRNWPSVIPKNIGKNDILRAIEILKENGIVDGSSDTVHLCNTLLPLGLIMLDFGNGEGWFSTQIYPIHPDTRLERRFSFTSADGKTEVWKLLKEQFDVAWEDPSFSHGV